MGGSKTSHARKSATAAATADKRRQCWPWSELPPTISYTHISRYQEFQMRNKNGYNSPAITKSYYLPRCINANQRPQLVHVTTGKASNPTAGISRHSQFLDDSATVDAQTMFDSENTSFWCVFRADSAPETIRTPPPTEIPYDRHRFDLLGPHPHVMTMMRIEGLSIPTSALVLNYVVSGKTGRHTYRTKCVSIRHECAAIDQFDSKKKPIEFTTSIIRSQGKFFALSLQGTLVVMEASNCQLKITGMSEIRAIPSSNWRFFKEYMVEMNGEILLVFLIHQESLAVVDQVEVFRLELAKLRWIRVERLGGKTLFLKGKCIWVDSAEFVCRDDCVYFAEGEDFWRAFDLKSGCFSTVIFQN